MHLSLRAAIVAFLSENSCSMVASNKNILVLPSCCLPFLQPCTCRVQCHYRSFVYKKTPKGTTFVKLKDCWIDLSQIRLQSLDFKYNSSLKCLCLLSKTQVVVTVRNPHLLCLYDEMFFFLDSDKFLYSSPIKYLVYIVLTHCVWSLYSKSAMLSKPFGLISCVSMCLCSDLCVSFPTLSHDDGLQSPIGAAHCLSYPPSTVAQGNSSLHCFSEQGVGRTGMHKSVSQTD